MDEHLGNAACPEGSPSHTDTDPLPREKASVSASSRNAFDPVGITREKLCL